jgi:hypothetical protein
MSTKVEFDITAEELRDCAVAAGIQVVPHHDCSVCGSEVKYIIAGENADLYFDPSCACTAGVGPEQREWQEAADWVNMQSTDPVRKQVAARFGWSE